MRAILVTSIVVLAFAVVLAAVPLYAQNDWEAGLFTEARQLPLVSQSQNVHIAGGEAVVELVQVFANEGVEVAQADYRLHLPSDATVSGFGFWREDKFLAAELKEKEQARQAHSAAAAAGRATGLLQREGTIHSFSVFPIAARSLQQVAITLRLPVATERGRSHVLLPMDSFLGHASLTSTALVQLETDGPLQGFGVEGVPHETLGQSARGAKFTFASDESAEIWWSEESPPLLATAESVSLEDGAGTLGFQLRVVLNDAGEWTTPYRELILLVDTSLSMRRRARAVADFLDRVLGESTAPIRLYSVAETTDQVHGSEPRERLRRLFSGREGIRARWTDLVSAAELAGCADPKVRCVAVTDPQIDGLETRSATRFETLFLADADELAYFGTVLGHGALVYQPDVEPHGKLNALADELVLPVLEITEANQAGGDLKFPESLRLRVAEGGVLRLFGTTRSAEPIELHMNVGGCDLVRTVALESTSKTSRLGLAIRRGVYGDLLDEWMASYRLNRDPDLKKQIVEVSLREEIPTALTALQVTEPEDSYGALPRTATTAPLLRELGWILTLFAGVVLLLTRLRP